MRKLLSGLFLCVVLTGCRASGNDLPPPPPPKVDVALPVLSQDVTDYEDFTGRTEPFQMVEVKARATGYLDKIYFKDGDYVEKDAPLFEVDPRPYQSEVNRAEASVAQAQARVDRLELEYKRGSTLLGQRVIAKEDFDKIAGDRGEAIATLAFAKANLRTAGIQLGFTKVNAKIAGLASLHNKDIGNIVKADDTLLTTIVALDPMYATFEIDERTLLRLRRLVQQKKIPSIEGKNVKFKMGLADETGFPVEGTVTFVDNRVDTGTGTLRLRGTFDNPNRGTKEEPKYLYAPGLFVRIRLEIGQPHEGLLISDKAISTNQNQKIVYVVGEGNKVAERPVKLGPMHHGMRVIESGLKTGERIVVTGLQRVRHGTEINPTLIDMPKAENGKKQ